MNIGTNTLNGEVNLTIPNLPLMSHRIETMSIRRYFKTSNTFFLIITEVDMTNSLTLEISSITKNSSRCLF